ncbi:hypothetical protein HYS31_02590 [Candidatus Woesearchaeota archaeon]|nr:hypothetical protein [Candidatus Woesearchaeota archaeon]
MVNIKVNLEKVLLAIFFGAFVFLGPGILFGHKISHEFPYAYFASDSFQHQVRADAIKDAGNFRQEAEYISFGIKNSIGRYPPLLYHLAVIFSYASGLEVYDSIYFIVIFFAIISVFLMYFLIRPFNRHAAFLSLPLAVLAFSQPASTGFLWGHWPSVLAQSFLIGFAWCISRLDMEKSYLLAGIMFSSVALAHTSEAVFGAIFVALFLAIKIIFKSLNKSEIKKFAMAFAISLIISLYYLPIFMNTWAKSQPWSYSFRPVWEGNPGFYIADFGIFLVFMAVGIAAALAKLKEMHTSLAFGFSMLIGGFLNYFGFDVRAFQIRFFWPLYLSVFFGLGIYFILRPAIKKWGIAHSSFFVLLFGILISGVFASVFDTEKIYIPHYKKFSSQGVMDTYHWDALKWLRESMGKDSKIYFLYGDIYSQDALLRNAKRVHYLVDPNDYISSINERKIKRSYVTEMPGDSGGLVAVRKGLFEFEYPLDSLPQEDFFGKKDICIFDYIVLDKASRQQALAQYNMMIGAELLKKSYIKKAFENEIVVVLKNDKKGDECIEERSF